MLPICNKQFQIRACTCPSSALIRTIVIFGNKLSVTSGCSAAILLINICCQSKTSCMRVLTPAWDVPCTSQIPGFAIHFV